MDQSAPPQDPSQVIEARLGGVSLPLRTSGNKIVDAAGNHVKLASVNWYGAEGMDHVVIGLERQPLQNIARLIRSGGFNSVRLPWSSEMWQQNPIIGDYALVANPELRGMNARDILKRVVDALATEGLLVILDHHMNRADWCCGSNASDSAMPYGGGYTLDGWIRDWQEIVAFFKYQPAVVGADLHNEPRGMYWGGGGWGDWHQFAEQGGNAVLGVNPNLLIIVEGLDFSYDLTQFVSNPVRLNVANRLVYSSHEYPFFGTHDYSSYEAFAAVIEARWGFVTNSYPVWVSEFGRAATGEELWTSYFVRYLKEKDIGWAYWGLNGTDETAPAVGRTFGSALDYCGYALADPNWTQLCPSLMATLGTIMSPGTSVSPPQSSPTPSANAVAIIAWSGRAVDVPGWSRDNVQLTIYDDLGQANQRFNFEADGTIRTFAGKCLNVSGNSTADGTPVIQYDCVGAPNEKFWRSGNEIRGLGNLCLDAAGDGGNGTPLTMWTCNGSLHQQWKLGGSTATAPPPPPSAGSSVAIVSWSGRAIDVPAWSRDNVQLTIYDDLGQANQRFTFEADGTIRTFAGKCLNVSGNSTADGTPVIQYDCVGAPNEQFWRSGTEIRGLGSLCLDATGDGGNGTPLTMWTCNGSTHQQWQVK
jgi:endoglucanase